MATKEVRFDIYCKTCKHYNKSESEDPCWNCLDQGWNDDSHKPIYWAEGDNKNGKQTDVKRKNPSTAATA